MPFWCEKFIVDGVKLRLALPKSHLYCRLSAAHIMAHIVACLQLLLQPVWCVYCSMSAARNVLMLQFSNVGLIRLCALHGTKCPLLTGFLLFSLLHQFIIKFQGPPLPPSLRFFLAGYGGLFKIQPVETTLLRCWVGGGNVLRQLSSHVH